MIFGIRQWTMELSYESETCRLSLAASSFLGVFLKEVGIRKVIDDQFTKKVQSLSPERGMALT